MNSSSNRLSWRQPALWLLLGYSAIGSASWVLADADSSESFPTSYSADKDKLRRWRDRFNNLSTEHQSRLRKIHGAVSSSDDSDRLLMVMLRYTDWLKSLPSAQKAELMEMALPQRVAEIKRLRQEEAKRQSAGPPSGLIPPRFPRGDMRVVMQWFRKVYVPRHERDIVESLPPWARQQIQNTPGGQRRKTSVVIFTRIVGMVRNKSLPPPTDQELEKLYTQLSAETIEQLDTAQSDHARAELLWEWIGAVMMDNARQRGPDPRHPEMFHEQHGGQRPPRPGFPLDGPRGGQFDGPRRGRPGPGQPGPRDKNRPDRPPRTKPPREN